MKQKFIYIIISFLLSQPSLLAQTEPSITFTEEDGLAGNIVRDVIRDKDGILWIGTDFGLSKYDGKNFNNIYKSDGLPSNKVWALEVDEENTVYVGCYLGGLAIYKNDSIEKVIHQVGKFPNSIRKLHYSNYYKKLLVGTDYGLFVLQDTTLIPIDFQKDSIGKSSILSISEYNSRIFFSVLGGISSGLYELSIDKNNLAKTRTNFITVIGRFANTIMNDTLYYSEYNGIFKTPLNNIQKQYPPSRIDTNFFIWNMNPYNDIELLIGGLDDGRFNGNYCILNTKTGAISNNPHQIKANTVLNVYNDTISNTFWLCTDNGITSLFNSPIEYNNFDNIGNIIDIGIVGDSLIVLTEDYLYYFYENNLIPILTKQQISSKIILEYGKYNKRFNEDFYKIVGTSSGCNFAYFIKDGDNLFLSTTKGAISVPDLETYYPFAVGTFKTINNKSAYSNVMYIPLRYFPSIKDSLGYINPTSKKGKITDIFKIIESNDILYLASSYSGISAIKDGKVYYLDENNSVIDNNLTDIEKDNNGNIWCTSINGNVFNIEFNDSLIIKSVLNPSNSGIIGKTCKWLIFNHDYLYVGTNKGLNVISTKKLYSENSMFKHFYNEYNGYEFISAKSPVKDKYGNIYVHTTEKLVKINAQIKSYPDIQILINDVIVNKIKVSIEKINDTELSFSTKDISFKFIATKYPTSKNIVYNYRVNNGEWISDNQINLQSLRAGDYYILLDVFDKETNHHYSKTISFEINKPFWLKLWFIALFAAALLIFIYIIVRIRISNLNKIHNERTNLIIRNSELKLRSLQLQMNPHFIFNALNSIQGFILTKSTENAILYLGNLSGIIRTNLENASEEYIHLTDEINFLKKYVELEKIRFKEKLHINFNNRVGDYNILLPPMLLQPIIENSIKHGILNLKSNGKIKIDFSMDSDSLLISVEDNGVGREFTKNIGNNNHNSFGLSIIKQRLELLNEKNHTDIHKMNTIDLYNDSVPTGTKVIIQLLLKTS